MKGRKTWIAAAVLAMGMSFAGFIGAPEAYAYYADASSFVSQGTDTRGLKYCAVNVVDDDGTVYTFYYRYKPKTDAIWYRVAGESQWRTFLEWGIKPHAPYPHLQILATAGLEVIKNHELKR